MKLEKDVWLKRFTIYCKWNAHFEHIIWEDIEWRFDNGWMPESAAEIYIAEIRNPSFPI